MSNQDRTEQELAEQRHAEHLKRLAEPGSNYAFGYLNALVQSFVDGQTTDKYLREVHAELQADLKAAKQ